jgi:hypothetical protein
MSDFKMKQEIKTLIKMGFNEEMATLVVAAKYGNLEMASDVVSGIADENDTIREALVDFKPYVPEDTTGQIITPQSSSSSSTIEYITDDNEIECEMKKWCEKYNHDYNDYYNNTENLKSNDIQEKADDKNENENL